MVETLGDSQPHKFGVPLCDQLGLMSPFHLVYTSPRNRTYQVVTITELISPRLRNNVGRFIQRHVSVIERRMKSITTFSFS